MKSLQMQENVDDIFLVKCIEFIESLGIFSNKSRKILQGFS